MTVILGISALYHDAAAALVVDGRIVAAAQEERFTRRKHDSRLPASAIAYCLDAAGLTADRIDYVGFYDKPLLKFERLLETYAAFAPRGFRSFATAMPVWLREKLFIERGIRACLGGAYRRRIVYGEHHVSHAASAFFPSPFDEAAILTLDGVGEWATASYGIGRGNRIELTHQQRFPHSLGLLYSAFTYFCGFRVNSGEYKLMGLAPYGQPRYVDTILDRLVDLRPDGSIWLDQSYFGYCDGLTMTNHRFAALFGGPPRKAESPITEREMDLAASVQVVTEEAMLRSARHIRQQTGMRRLCLAGGVALNCVGNGRIVADGIFDDVWVQPAAGDAGGALGVALHIWHELLGQPRVPEPVDSMRGSLLGPEYRDEDIAALLAERGAVARRFDTDEACDRYVADLLAREQVVGMFRGRMEFGPRALGARSILGDARSPRLQSTMNVKIKFRESFRPFAPAVDAARTTEYFDLPEHIESPYMLVVAPVATSQRVNGAGADTARGLDKLKTVRSTVPAVTHVDYSARVQTVDAERSPRFHGLIKAFSEQTGCPVVINTSFNVRGEPIVCTPADAYRCFLATNIDALVLERHVLEKKDQPQAAGVDAAAYLKQFAPD
jgi:carbamoyltransferase